MNNSPSGCLWVWWVYVCVRWTFTQFSNSSKSLFYIDCCRNIFLTLWPNGKQVSWNNRTVFVGAFTPAISSVNETICKEETIVRVWEIEMQQTFKENKTRAFYRFSDANSREKNDDKNISILHRQSKCFHSPVLLSLRYFNLKMWHFQQTN